MIDEITFCLTELEKNRMNLIEILTEIFRKKWKLQPWHWPHTESLRLEIKIRYIGLCSRGSLLWRGWNNIRVGIYFFQLKGKGKIEFTTGHYIYRPFQQQPPFYCGVDVLEGGSKKHRYHAGFSKFISQSPVFILTRWNAWIIKLFKFDGKAVNF